MINLRKLTYNYLETDPADTQQASVINKFLVILIFINVGSATLETVSGIAGSFSRIFSIIEIFSIIIFTIEYGLRIWVSIENPKQTSRFAYIVSPASIIDFISIFPFYLSFVLGLNLHVFIILRLLRLLKLIRYFEPLSILGSALKAEFNSFMSALFILFILVMIASAGMYLIERDIQPDVFGNIPQAMWWAVVTLTTMGYGDVIPATPFGKIFASVITILSIGTVALPAGMLASRFSEELKNRKEKFSAIAMKTQQNGNLCDQDKATLETIRQEMSLTKQEAEHLVESACTKGKGKCPYCGQEINQNENRNNDFTGTSKS